MMIRETLYLMLEDEGVLLSARRIAVLIGFLASFLLAFAFVLLLLMGIQHFRLNSAESNFNDMLLSKKQVIEKNEKLEQLINEKEELNSEVAFNEKSRQIVQSLNQLRFSSSLEALVKSKTAGVWLTNINLNNGTQSIQLKGVSKSPELLMKMLQSLHQKDVFQDREYKVFDLNKESDNPNYTFQVIGGPSS